MKLTVQLKLKPTPEQADALKRTLETANAACNYISQVAWERKTFQQFAIHRLTYQAVRATFGLAAQLTVRCIAKVADAYKLDRKVQRLFAPHGAIAYDNRILSFALPDSLVSIWTLDGRQAIPFVCGERQRALLNHQRGESDLVFAHGSWYVFATCEVETPEVFEADSVLGIDLGVTNIATDSDGETHSGKVIKNVRYRHRRLRNKLQQRGTLGSRRRLRQLAGQERRFATWVNHNLSKRIVAKAECTKRAIALEDLRHIRTRMKARRSQRATLHAWAFAQLRSFIAYKAQLRGVPVHFVDPRNTSRTCPECGHCAKENRKTQASFVCTSCGFAGPADVIAAGTIARRAAVNRPYCSEADASVAPEQSRRL
ncbi:MAG TPA: transposase [Roseiflexaceae bacterium]|nr:transposase [Roseiflexaceae bacterium]